MSDAIRRPNVNKCWVDVAPWYERSIMVQWVVGSILHGVDPLSHFSFQPVLHDCCNKVRGMVHIKEPLLLIGKSSPCGFIKTLRAFHTPRIGLLICENEKQAGIASPAKRPSLQTRSL